MPEGLQGAIENNELEVVAKSRERVYECDQQGEIDRHLRGVSDLASAITF
jgi:hypothetical protein